MDASLVTLDTDWAPDAAIDLAAEILLRHGVKATWFITHASPAINRLREHADLFELGIHPNFLPGSSHGKTPQEIIDHCMTLVPEARAMRTHALVQSTPLLHTIMQTTPICSDYSILLFRAQGMQAAAYPFNGKSLLRVPTIWEDDVEMAMSSPAWDVRLIGGAGLRAYGFHPIHVFLNSADMNPYGALKQAVTPLSAATHEQMAPFANQGQGARTAFEGLASHLASTGKHWCARDVMRAHMEMNS
jgi:hypothetical protein